MQGPYAARRYFHGLVDRHLVARHSGAGHRQARPGGGESAALGPLSGSSRPRRHARRQRKLGCLSRRLAAGEDLQAEASAEAARLEAKFTDQDLERLIRAKGVDNAAGASAAAADLGKPAASLDESA